MPMELFVLVFLRDSSFGVALVCAGSGIDHGALQPRHCCWELQAYAVATGLASAANHPAWVWTGVLALTAGYMVAVLLLCAFGISPGQRLQIISKQAIEPADRLACSHPGENHALRNPLARERLYSPNKPARGTMPVPGLSR